MGVRPIQLWEIAFPEEHYDLVMRSLAPNILTTKSQGLLRKVISIMFKIKKLMGLDDCPEWKKEGTFFILNPGAKKFIDIKALGVKRDKHAKVELV